ncbi:MAG: DUF4249 domain-containing protein [Saprospiraceae bacterium]|nr:DUF4249 domain-containing protein [Saprospiraceae bacterium]
MKPSYPTFLMPDDANGPKSILGHQAKWIYLAISLAISLCFASCLQTIDFEVEKDKLEGIAIDAVLNVGRDASVDVTLAQLFNFSFESTRPLEEAQVTLENTIGQSIEIPASVIGSYSRKITDGDAFELKDGMGFRILLAMQDGSKIQSDFDYLWSAASTPSLRKNPIEVFITRRDQVLTRDAFEFFTSLHIESTEPNANGRYRWDVLETFRVFNADGECYFTNPLDVNNVKVFDANSISATGEYRLLSRVINPFRAEGYYIQVIRRSLSQEAYSYWSEVDRTITRMGGQFEEAPGRVRTNFSYVEGQSRDLFGFFYATHSDTTRIYVSPEEAKFVPPTCLSGQGISSFCQGYNNQNGGTKLKPSWWDAD